MRRRTMVPFMTLLLCVGACGSAGAGPPGPDAGPDAAGADAGPDVPADTAGARDAAAAPDAAGSPDTVPAIPDAAPDAPADADAAPPPRPTFGPLTTRPTASLLPVAIESCPVFQAERCQAGTLERCALYDATTGDWTDAPDPWALQIAWYDRYFDLYHRMEGQQSEFRYTRPMPPGTPESEWGAPESFERYDGVWDSSGWTGTALQSAAARYRVTGTEADYARMLDQLDAMLFQYEATGVPGLLMRVHYAMLPEGAPDPVGHPGKALVHYTGPTAWEDHNRLAPEYLDRLPTYYRDGVTIGGQHYPVEAKWMGHASRDMYVRSLPGILLAYDLLGEGEREDRLRAVARAELPCTLKRMKRLRIRNLQQNEQVRTAVASYLGANQLRLDPGDLDITALDTVHAWVLEEPHPAHPDSFDPTCPDTLPTEVDPAYDLDASATGDFVLRFVSIMNRLNGQADVPIAWIQVPSVRGADALFMAQWALAGHYLTGDARFLDFLDTLMADTDFWQVVDTMGSFWLPKWCRSHYGPSLLYPTLWNLQTRIDRARFPTWWTRLATAIHEEIRDKELVDANDAYFGVLYAKMVDATIDPDAPAYVARMVQLLSATEQYPCPDRNEPRRSYDIDWLTTPPPGFDVAIEPLSAEDRATCLTPIEVFGFRLEGTLWDENPRAVEGLPLRWRYAGPFQWQEDPYQLVKSYGDLHARIQWPMQGESVAYWTGRMQGTITAGAGLALGWRPTPTSCR